MTMAIRPKIYVMEYAVTTLACSSAMRAAGSASLEMASVAVPTTADSVAAPAIMPAAVPWSRPRKRVASSTSASTTTTSIRQSIPKRKPLAFRLAKNWGPPA